MVPMTAETRALARLRERLQGQRSGAVEVIDVRTEYLLDWDADEYVVATLVLSDPPSGRETWPLESVYDLETRAREAAAGLEIGTRVAVRVRARDDYDDVRTDR